MKIRIISALCAVMMLSGCTPAVSTPCDEIRLYQWSCELENGNIMTLCFRDADAKLSVKNHDFSSLVEGQYVLSDDSLVICDRDTGENFRFDYTLHGDRIELIYGGGTVELLKKI